MGLHIRLLVLLAGWVCVGESMAVTIPADAKVGLVLSGGGARGLAHVGVIRVLEAQGIRPVVVTGTSMGSIVAALYAAGRSADEIDHIARNMDWRQALSDESPRRHQPYQFRQLEAGMTTDLRMSISRKGITFPRGVIEGQHLEQVLGELFTQDGQPLQFDELPIRFAAVAADLETGEEVIMDTGDVAQAVRASMSIPGALAPVQRGEHLLVDGGIVNNMPIDLARKMGADYIIAVDVSSPLAKRDQLTSVFSVAGQMTTLLVHVNSSRQLQLLRANDWLITPDLTPFGSADFDKADSIIRAGTEAALAGFRHPNELPAVQATDTQSQGNQSEPVIDFIRVKNNSPVGDNVVRAQIHQQEGQPLDHAQLEEDLSRLYGLDYFSVVRYRLLRENGRTGLEIDSVARETGNNWLKLGLELADDFRGNSDFNLSASLRASGLNRYGGTAFTRLQLGSRPEFELRYLQPLDPALRYFAEPAVGYRSYNVDLYAPDIQDEPYSTYNKADSWAGLSVGRLLWEEVAEIRTGIMRATGRLDFRNGIDLFQDAGEDTHYDDGYYFLSLGWDSLDDLGFPQEGMRSSLAFEAHQESLSAEDDFGRYLGDFSLALSHQLSTVVLEADIAISDSDDSSFVDIPFIGGFLELSGLPPNSRFGRHRALTRIVFYQQLDKNGPLPMGIPVFLGGSLEKGNVWLNRDDVSWDNTINAGSVFLGARTPLGPAYLSFGMTDEGDKSLSLFLGQRFR